MKSFKRFLFLFIAAGLAFSCSDDESNEAIYEAPKLPLTTRITTTGTHNRVYIINYDALKRISKIAVSGQQQRVYTFEYNADNLITKAVVTAGSTFSFVFHYDENKIYTGFTATPGGDNHATYDEVTKTYDLTTAFGNAVHVKVDSDYDIDTIHDFDDEDPVTFRYDPAVKGPFASSPGNIHFIMSLLDVDFLYFATKKAPVRASMDVEQEYYQYTNESFNGFVIETDLVSPALTMNIDYDYTWL